MTEYYISEMKGDGSLFKLAKFDGRDEPENVYFVVMKQIKGGTPEMHCDCPNRRRGKHINDKHGQMVAKWLIAGKPAGHFDAQGDFHGQDRRQADDQPSNAEGDSEPDDELDESDEEDSAI